VSRARLGQQPETRAGHIGWVEATAIILVHMISKVFLIFPSRISMGAQTAAWSVPFFSGILSVLWIWPLISVLRAYPGKGIVDISRSLLGPFPSFAIATLYYLFNASIVALSVDEISEAVTGVMLPLTPERFLRFVGLAVSLYLAMQGLEGLARMSVVGIFLVIGFILLTLILSFNLWTWDSVFPVLGPGPVRLAKTYVVRQAMYGEVVSLGILAPYLRNPSDVGKIARWSGLIAGAAFSLVILACEMVFPYPTLNHTLEPLLRVTRMIYLGRFFQRVEVILSPVWLASATIHIAIGILVSSLVLSSMLPIKSLAFLEVVTTAVVAGLASLVPDMATQMIANFDILRPYGLILVAGWPLALWAADRSKRQKGRAKESKRQ